ncbi:MAG: hypothetical protein R3A12_19015 [Ignavibacteria bacterium]
MPTFQRGISFDDRGQCTGKITVFRWADQFDFGNALVKRKVFLKTGMFDRQFDKQRMGDGEFGMRHFLQDSEAFQIHLQNEYI